MNVCLPCDDQNANRVIGEERIPHGCTDLACLCCGGESPARRYTFTRDQLADALEGITVTTKMVNGSIKIGAESMADAIIEALDERPAS